MAEPTPAKPIGLRDLNGDVLAEFDIPGSESPEFLVYNNRFFKKTYENEYQEVRAYTVPAPAAAPAEASK